MKKRKGGETKGEGRGGDSLWCVAYCSIVP